MKNKISVTDNILIEISKHKIEIFTFLPFNIRVNFEETVVDTLDEDGEMFGKKYQLNIFAKPKYMDECMSESDVSSTISNYREKRSGNSLKITKRICLKWQVTKEKSNDENTSD